MTRSARRTGSLTRARSLPTLLPRTARAVAFPVLASVLMMAPATALATPDGVNPVSLNAAIWGTATPASGNVFGMGVTTARAAGYSGVLGDNVTVVNLDAPLSDPDHIQFFNHPVQIATGSVGPNGDAHGLASTSVVGGNGVGIVPSANLVHATPQPNVHTMPFAVPYATAGDVILMEQAVGTSQTPTGQNYDVPYELYGIENDNALTRRETRAAVDRGINVVEAAGNGNNGGRPAGVAEDGANLDWPQLAKYFRKDASGAIIPADDSGTIMVGAGEPIPTAYCGDPKKPARSRSSLSTYGVRVDVQAPVDCNTAATIYEASNPGASWRYPAGSDTHHAYGFHTGTSGASAVVAGATAAVASAYEEWSAAHVPATPDAVRNALRRTATAQVDTPAQPASKHIGGLVNVKGAIDDLEAAPTTNAPTGPASTSSTKPTFAVSGASGSTFQCRVVPDPLPTYEQLVQKSLDPWAPCSGGTTHTPATALATGSYVMQSRAVKTDAKGVTFDATPGTLKFTVVANGSLATVASGVLQVSAPSRSTTLSVTTNGTTQYVVQDALGVLAGTSCSQSGPYKAICAASAITSVRMQGGAGGDTLTENVPVPATLNGGLGDDSLVPLGTGAATIQGGAGSDTVDYSSLDVAIKASFDGVANDGPANATLDNITSDVEVAWGGSAADTFVSGPGNQTLAGFGGSDVYKIVGGGTDVITDINPVGTDAVDFSGLTTAVTVTPATGGGMQATATGETLSMKGIDVITGTPLADTITTDNSGVGVIAGAGDDKVTGGSGDDVLNGGAGKDALIGGAGDDTFNAKDTLAETVDCGTGDDVASLDTIDVATSCETKFF